MSGIPVLRVRNEKGNIIEIPAIKGDKGDPGDGGKSTREIIDIIYPVGSIYISANAADPSTLFEGTTWQQIQGRFLFGAGNCYDDDDVLAEAELGSTGGYYNAELIKHTHDQFYPSAQTGIVSGDERYAADPVIEGYTQTTGETGKVESGTGRNMPPYLAVNIWKRTA